MRCPADLFFLRRLVAIELLDSGDKALFSGDIVPTPKPLGSRKPDANALFADLRIPPAGKSWQA